MLLSLECILQKAEGIMYKCAQLGRPGTSKDTCARLGRGRHPPSGMAKDTCSVMARALQGILIFSYYALPVASNDTNKLLASGGRRHCGRPAWIILRHDARINLRRSRLVLGLVVVAALLFGILIAVLVLGLLVHRYTNNHNKHLYHRRK